MSYSQISFTIGAFYGLTGVIAGALGAHALESQLDASQLDSFETAVRFQMYHALLLLLLGGLQVLFPQRMLRIISIGIVVGTLLFSGSIYLLTLTAAPVGLVTPLGGLVLILSWGGLLVWAIRFTSSPTKSPHQSENLSQ